MLTEEIEDIIVTEAEAVILAGHTWDKAWPIAARFAAKAIAKRLSEEDEKRLEEATWQIEKLLKEAEEEAAAQVVWDTEGFVVHGKKTSVIRIAGSGANLYPKEMLDCDDGQLVKVTVKIMEPE